MSDNEAPEKKPKPEGSELINLKVKDDENESFFKVKMSTKLGKLRKAWADKMERTPESIRLMYDGERVDPLQDTPASLGMEDGDELMVFNEQIGGRC